MERGNIITVAGVKNSGKTTVLEGLVAELARRGLNAAIIKHDGHRFDPDRPGTDSFRCLAAGAVGAAVFDGEKFQLVKYAAVTEAELAAQFPEADVILLEGFKNSPWPKIEVVRAGNSDGPVCAPDDLLALVTDLPLALPGIPTLGFEDIAGLAELVLQFLGRWSP